jgi:hypothetical protein
MRAHETEFPSSIPAPDGLQVPEAPVRGVIWHFSDLHFPPEDINRLDQKGRIRGREIATPEPFAELLEWVRDQKQWRADFLVVSGDFVHARSIVDQEKKEKDENEEAADAMPGGAKEPTVRERAFAQAKDFVKSLAAEVAGVLPPVVVVCPGNHDVDMAVASDGPHTDGLSAYRQALGGHVQPGKAPTIALRNACLLALDTTGLTGRLFDLPKALVGPDAEADTRVDIQADAALYDLDEIKQALEGCENAAAVKRGEMLGIVVAHHPPSAVPSLWVELKPFAETVAAAQAKTYLSRRGFRVFLHGHKHAAVAQEEQVFPANNEMHEGVLVLGAAAFSAKGDSDQGFSVIEYLVAPASGEARLVLHPFGLHGGRPKNLETRRFSLPPQERAPAGTIRLSAVIDEQGDCQLDSEFLEIPTPSRPLVPWGGWRPVPGGSIRSFSRQVLPDLDVPISPKVHGTSPGSHAAVESEKVHEPHDDRSYDIHLRADANCKYASFMERVFMHGAYSVSRAHQRRVGGTASLIPGVGDGWEGIMHVMREPANRLEIMIDMPFAMEAEYKVGVMAYVFCEGNFVREHSILGFSPVHQAVNPLARRILVRIDSPVVGVAYVVRWQLPEDAPENREPSDIPYYNGHRLLADSLRLKVRECGKMIAAEEFRKRLSGEIGDVLEQLGTSRRGERRPDLRWSLYVPEHSLLDDDPTRERNVLVPRLSSHGAPDASWRPWEVGKGVAGRAYALNRVIEAVGRTSARYRKPSARESWMLSDVGVYEPVPQGVPHPHSVLYGIPLHAPNRPELIWGVFCIGTWTSQAGLDLNEKLDAKEPGTGLTMLQEALQRFSVWLAGLG